LSATVNAALRGFNLLHGLKVAPGDLLIAPFLVKQTIGISGAKEAFERAPGSQPITFLDARDLAQPFFVQWQSAQLVVGENQAKVGADFIVEQVSGIPIPVTRKEPKPSIILHVAHVESLKLSPHLAG